MSTKKLLLTGFEPFLDHPINPTQHVVEQLNTKTIGQYEVVGEILPVIFEEAGEKMKQLIKQHHPDAVISLGLSAGRHMITPERIAINCQDGPKDNEGRVFEDAPIVVDGPDAYFSTLPIRQMVNQLKEHHLPATISNTAGTYVCNHVMYATLHFLHKTNSEHVRAGFIHIPSNHELAMHQPKYPSLSSADLVKGISLCIETL